MTAFLAWLLPLLAKLGLDFWTHRGPSEATQEAEKAGAAQADLATSEQAVKTEAAVAQAEVNSPQSKADLDASLSDGTF